MDKTTRNPTDHELNEVLARVVGISVDEMTDPTGINPKPKIFVYAPTPKGICEEWDPIGNASQMEKVEDKLKEQGWEMIVGWSKVTGRHWTELRSDTKAFWSNDANRKRCVALVIDQMQRHKPKFLTP